MQIKKAETDLTVKKSQLVTRLLPIFLFLFGLSYGAAAYNYIVASEGSLLGMSQAFLESYLNQVNNVAPFLRFLHGFLQSGAFLAAAYLLGYSAIGQPLALSLMPIKGLCSGFLMAGLYSSFGVKAAVYSAVFIVPELLVFLFCLMTATRESISLSNILFFSLWPDKGKQPASSVVKLYNFKFAVLTLIALGGAAFELVCHLLLGKIILLN